LPDIVKIDLYNCKLYRFKVGSFFETQCTLSISGYLYVNSPVHKPTSSVAKLRCSPLQP